MPGNEDAIIARYQKQMEAIVKQDFATLESVLADVRGPDQGTAGQSRAIRTKKLAEGTESLGREAWSILSPWSGVQCPLRHLLKAGPH